MSGTISRAQVNVVERNKVIVLPEKLRQTLPCPLNATTFLLRNYACYANISKHANKSFNIPGLLLFLPCGFDIASCMLIVFITRRF